MFIFDNPHCYLFWRQTIQQTLFAELLKEVSLMMAATGKIKEHRDQDGFFFGQASRPGFTSSHLYFDTIQPGCSFIA